MGLQWLLTATMAVVPLVSGDLVKIGNPVANPEAKGLAPGPIGPGTTTKGAETSINYADNGFSDVPTDYVTEIITETAEITRFVEGNEGCLSGRNCSMLEIILTGPEDITHEMIVNLTKALNEFACELPECLEFHDPVHLVDYYFEKSTKGDQITHIIYSVCNEGCIEALTSGLGSRAAYNALQASGLVGRDSIAVIKDGVTLAPAGNAGYKCDPIPGCLISKCFSDGPACLQCDVDMITNTNLTACEDFTCPIRDFGSGCDVSDGQLYCGYESLYESKVLVATGNITQACLVDQCSTANATTIQGCSAFISAAQCDRAPIVTAYTPLFDTCDADQLATVKEYVGKIDAREAAWIKDKRESKAQDSFSDYLEAAFELTRAQKNAIDDDAIPRIGIAASGGGLRAMLAIGGQLANTDARVTGTNKLSKSKGLFQASSYFAGVSGGNWLVASLLANDPAIKNIEDWATSKPTGLPTIRRPRFINLDNNVFQPGINQIAAAKNWLTFALQLVSKTQAAAQQFESTVVDLWGRGMSYQILNNLKGFGAGLLLSDYATEDSPDGGSGNTFKEGDFPFPILVASTNVIGQDNYVFGEDFEWTPFFSGVTDSQIRTTLDTANIGTSFKEGQVVDDARCASRFDNLGFAFATSSAAFSQPNFPDVALRIINRLLSERLGRDVDITSLGLANSTNGVVPAPYFEQPYITNNLYKDQETMLLGDGALGDSGNLPLNSLVSHIPAPQANDTSAKDRQINVILTMDSSSNVNDFPDGSAVIKAAEFAAKQTPVLPFPDVPADTATFVNEGLDKGVSAFGCFDDTVSTMIYIPNQEVSFATNTSTFQLAYTEAEILGFMQNGKDTLTLSITSGAVTYTVEEAIACIMANTRKNPSGETQLDLWLAMGPLNRPALATRCPAIFTEVCWTPTP